jgi:hypothetical protein
VGQRQSQKIASEKIKKLEKGTYEKRTIHGSLKEGNLGMRFYRDGSMLHFKHELALQIKNNT